TRRYFTSQRLGAPVAGTDQRTSRSPDEQTGPTCESLETSPLTARVSRGRSQTRTASASAVARRVPRLSKIALRTELLPGLLPTGKRSSSRHDGTSQTRA